MLTQKDAQGNWSVNGIRWDEIRPGNVITEEMVGALYGALWKLKDYEDTGLEPDEVDYMQFKAARRQETDISELSEAISRQARKTQETYT